ncbi:MAG TPA: hypothetical protein VG013_28335, partial [Gemmataceae bacterium]|nr:hypothetical protein [Gemmataceae bacterium]
EVQRLLREADQLAYSHLERHRSELDRLADALLQREELSRGDIDRLLRENHIEADGHPTSGVIFAPGSPKL